LQNEPNWLPIDAVIEINRAEVSESGESHFLRDFGLLDSALARARNAFAYGEEDVVTLAVVMMSGIAQSHAFEQGNKRTAFAALRLFLQGNGYDTSFDDTLSWANAVIGLIEHRLSEEDFARALRPYIVPLP
jgi:death on curing protein